MQSNFLGLCREKLTGDFNLLPKGATTIGILVILLAPVITFLVPSSIAETIVASNITIKDVVLLICVATLGVINYSISGYRWFARWLRFKPYNQQAIFNYTYFTDGTVLTRNQFDYVNGWKKQSNLSREDLIWHQEISKSDIFYRFYQRGVLADRSMSSEEPTIITATPKKATNAGAVDFRYSWLPIVTPALGKKETISFIVEILASKTEVAAFDEGTKMGFGVNILTNRARLIANAPFGYRFVLLLPEATIRNSYTLEEIAIRPKRKPRPMVSPDGSKLILEVKRPKINRRYWVHYRFEKILAQ